MGRGTSRTTRRDAESLGPWPPRALSRSRRFRRCARAPGPPDGADDRGPARPRHATSRLLYSENCAGCHGPSGRGGAGAIGLADAVYLAVADDARPAPRGGQRRARNADAGVREELGRDAHRRADRDPRPRHSRLGASPTRSPERAAPPYAGAARRRRARRRGLRAFLRRVPRRRPGAAGRRPDRSWTERFLGLVSDQSLRTTSSRAARTSGSPTGAATVAAPLTGRGRLGRRGVARGAAPGASRSALRGGEAMTAPITRRRLLLKLGIALNAVAGLALAMPIVGYLLSPGAPQAHGGSADVGRARRARRISRKGRPAWRPSATPRRGPGTARPPTSRAGCGAPVPTRIPGLRRQLRAPRLPGALVSAVEPLPVPVPRRRVLRRRQPRRRSAAAGPLPLRLQGRERRGSRSRPA